MKTAEWFVCLSYPKADILIPQKVIKGSSSYFAAAGGSASGSAATDGLSAEDGSAKSDGSFAEGGADSGGREISLDKEFGSLLFDSCGGKKLMASLLIDADVPMAVHSSVVPEMVLVPAGEFRIFGEIFARPLLKKGIEACRFSNGRIQYVLNAENLSGSGKGGVL